MPFWIQKDDPQAACRPESKYTDYEYNDPNFPHGNCILSLYLSELDTDARGDPKADIIFNYISEEYREWWTDMHSQASYNWNR